MLRLGRYMVGLLLLACVYGLLNKNAIAQTSDEKATPDWVAEIEKVFVRSEDCKQCHDRHYDEWKGVREQTPDLKTFGRVDAALLHGTSLDSPVFRTVLGLWGQTNPTVEERGRCLACHVPSTAVFPQHVEKIMEQILAGKPQIEGIGCASCHLIHDVDRTVNPPPTFRLKPGPMLYGPFADPEENLVHQAAQSPLFREAAYCASCHFDKVKDVTQKGLPGEILQGTVCQDCHMEPSTGSSTSRRGAMTRAIGRHWFRGVVVSGTMLRNRNLQAEWTPRVDIDVRKTAGALEGTVLVKIGSLPHSFPDGDPVLKQFFLTVTAKDAAGHVLAEETKQFGLPYDKILRGPIPDPFIKGGHTRKVPFALMLPDGSAAATVEAVLTYALIPTPDPALQEKYLAILSGGKERDEAKQIIHEYTRPRMLTYRAKSL
ncbi:MAG: multiheme c-type cytochrome [Nitrospira sp.]|nr:multiheme c-type cytochrome [Nitrospira sp.]